jgi:hypothetical protein
MLWVCVWAPHRSQVPAGGVGAGDAREHGGIPGDGRWEDSHCSAAVVRLGAPRL